MAHCVVAALALAEVVVDVDALIQGDAALGHVLHNIDHEITHEGAVVPRIFLAPQHVLRRDSPTCPFMLHTEDT